MGRKRYGRENLRKAAREAEVGFNSGRLLMYDMAVESEVVGDIT